MAGPKVCSRSGPYPILSLRHRILNETIDVQRHLAVSFPSIKLQSRDVKTYKCANNVGAKNLISGKIFT